MLVRHYMTSPVKTVREDTPCREALELFRRERIRRAPVLRGERLVGMVSERDLLRVLPGAVGDLESAAGLISELALIGQVLTRDPCTTTPDAHLEDVARRLLERRIGGLPVLDGGRLVGILTESDLLRALVELASAPGSARLTLIPPRPAFVPVEALPETCLRLGLRLVTLLHHASAGGEPLVLLRVAGARWRELPEALADQGYRVIELVPPTARAA